MPADRKRAIDLADRIVDRAMRATKSKGEEHNVKTDDLTDEDRELIGAPLSKGQRDALEAGRLRREERLRQWRASPEGQAMEAELDRELAASEAAEERRLRDSTTRARAPMLGLVERSLADTPAPPAGSGSTVRVGQEPAVYGPGSDFSYFRDRFADALSMTPGVIPPRGGDMAPRSVRERLHRHQSQMAYLATRGTGEERQLIRSYFVEKNRPFHGTPMDRSRRDFSDFWQSAERRDVNTGSGSMGDFAPPVYVLERWAMYRTAASPVASQAGQAPLPATGMTVDIPQVTGAVTMGVQASENTNVSNSSPTSTQTGTPVLTAAGIVEISQQTLDRFGPGVRADEVIAEQAARQAATTIDTQAIAAVFTSPAATITNSNSPGIEALWADVTKAGADIAAQEGTRLSATHVMMPSVNMKWFQSLLDSEGRPIWTPSPAATLARVGQVNTRSEGYTGYDIAGFQAWEDSNIPTSGGYAQVLVGDLPDGLLVMTGTPIVDIHPEFQPTTLTAAISIRQYFALAVLYPDAFVQITGAAYLASPSWTGG